MGVLRSDTSCNCKQMWSPGWDTKENFPSHWTCVQSFCSVAPRCGDREELLCGLGAPSRLCNAFHLFGFFFFFLRLPRCPGSLLLGENKGAATGALPLGWGLLEALFITSSLGLHYHFRTQHEADSIQVQSLIFSMFVTMGPMSHVKQEDYKFTVSPNNLERSSKTESKKRLGQRELSGG